MSSKLREAVEKIYSKAKEYDEGGEYLGEGSDPGFERIMKMCESALAEPLRNCDVGTPQEQAKRFKNYCNSKVCKRNVCHSCGYEELFHHKCFPIWGQMPYEKEGEE